MLPLAIRCLDSPILSADRAFGWDEQAGTVFAVSTGYFLWDTIDSIMHFEALSFVAHGSFHISMFDSCTSLRVAGHRHSMFLRLLLVLRKSAPRPVKNSSDVLCSVRSWHIMACDTCFGRGKQTAIRSIIPFTLRQTLQEHNLFEFPLVTVCVATGFEGD